MESAIMQLNLTSSYGGLNLIDPLDAMNPEYAIQMDNVIPYSTGDQVRTGYVKRLASGASMLIPSPISTKERLICYDDGELNAYSPADFETVKATKSGFTSDAWKYTQFTDGAGQAYTIIANGVDTAQSFANDTFSDVGYTLTGISYLDSPLSFKNRLYFVGGDWDIYYSGVQSISGSLTQFSVGSYFKKGGRILTIENWTQDAGQGIDDLFVIFSTEGEVMIFKGTSPEASDWQTLGVFQIPRPVGKWCCENVGADIVVITEQGYLPLSAVLSDIRANRTTISAKINPIVKGKDFTNAKWEIHFYSTAGWLIINAPSNVPKYAHEQHVLNIQTNSWCRFLGLDGQSFCVLNDKLYFANTSGVYEANKGTTDNGDWIIYKVQKAYNQFNIPLKKQLMRIVPRYSAYSATDLYKCINSDFKEGKNRIIIQRNSNGYQSYWDTAIWDVNYWSDEYTAYKTRASVQSKVGSFLSIGFYGRTKTEFEFYSTGLILKAGTGHI